MASVIANKGANEDRAGGAGDRERGIAPMAAISFRPAILATYSIVSSGSPLPVARWPA
jgi:hypothetical protein